MTPPHTPQVRSGTPAPALAADYRLRGVGSPGVRVYGQLPRVTVDPMVERASERAEVAGPGTRRLRTKHPGGWAGRSTDMRPPYRRPAIRGPVTITGTEANGPPFSSPTARGGHTPREASALTVAAPGRRAYADRPSAAPFTPVPPPLMLAETDTVLRELLRKEPSDGGGHSRGGKRWRDELPHHRHRRPSARRRVVEEEGRAGERAPFHPVGDPERIVRAPPHRKARRATPERLDP
jgi:hypothetical protein